jgi:LuxR family maltose regulon positive regulatory protein
MTGPKPLAVIDTPQDRSVSFAPPDPDDSGELARSFGVRPPIGVGPGRAALATSARAGGASRDGVNDYPIKLGKVQRPSLRDETLARHRLLDWLDVKIHNRIVLVIADAGYGKTTLLADFSGRTRLRTLWYRMDEEDRNWVSFLSYLVAAGRVHDPEFAPRTAGLLRHTGPGGASRDDVTEAFFHELPTIAADPTALILDDFHVADDVPDVRNIARQLVERSPERLTLVFSSRRMPAVPVARLRALGEVAELRTADLRFSPAETEALFENTYRRPLEADVLADLSRRTEGWAASLYLVQTALRDRTSSETRAFVRGLSGAQSELYDYLAEEVVGDLSLDHQQFLMRTSILESVHPEQAAVVTSLELPQIAALIGESERLGLLSRRNERRRPGHTYHPLVREFLEARLRRELGDDLVVTLHRAVARWAEATQWRTACFHFSAAADYTDLHRVLAGSVESIVGAGEVALASEYLSRFPSSQTTAGFEIIRSRQAGSKGDVPAAVAHARSAVALEPESDAAIGNLMQALFLIGGLNEARALASRLASSAQSSTLRNVGAATWHLLNASSDGHLEEALEALARVTEESRRSGLTHYEGVSLLNSALIQRARGAATESLRDASDAVDALSRSSSGVETVSALLAQAWATAHLGRLDVARLILASAAERGTAATRHEWLFEAAEIEIGYGDEALARYHLEEAAATNTSSSLAALTELARVQLALRVGDIPTAKNHLPIARPSVPTHESAHLSRYLTMAAHVSVADQSTTAHDRILEAMDFAERQGAGLWVGYCQVLLASISREGQNRLGRAIATGPVYLSLVAEPLLEILDEIDSASMDVIAAEARMRPQRWRSSVRRVALQENHRSRLRAAEILDEIGESTDVPLLRSIARKTRSSQPGAALGRGLARRLATPVEVEDQGRVEIHAGSSVIPGTSLRRKVLAALCFLLTRPRFSATRDEVVDALWPDMAPDVAVNSLNQTVYFLRRVFEPGYKEDLSAGYVNHDSDVIWLDSDLIHSRSNRCRQLLDAMGADPSPAEVDTLSETYRGRFALDFSYEEWAVPFRDALHVAYLHVIEAAVNRDMETGHFDRGIRLARKALDIDSDLENLELSLLRLYRATGAHSAAAEQYSHYSAYLRKELGLEPPPLASL